MAKKGFDRKSFRKWLDILAKVVVKARDNHTCQIHIDDACAGAMPPGDNNCQWCHITGRNNNNLRWDLLNALTGCGHCHRWAHDNPVQFGRWLETTYPHIATYISMPVHNVHRTWKEDDYLEIERRLLEKAVELDVDFMWVPTSSGYREKFVRRLLETERRLNKEKS